jgi:hypothetical protein
MSASVQEPANYHECVSVEAERPLRVSEIFAESMRLYGERTWAVLGIGAVQALTFVLAILAGRAGGFVVLAASFTLVFAAAARIVAGDGFGEAWGQVAVRLDVLAPLGFVVAVPFAATFGYLVLLPVAIAWLALTSFAIPVAMLERDRVAEGWFARLGYALRRAITLARAGYWHAVAVAAALVLVYLVFGVLLANLLVGFAENSGDVAVILVQLVLAPFFFCGLSVHYFDQRARRAEAPRGTTSPAA